MKTNRVIKIFLASSEELEADRYRFGNLIRKLDNIYEKRGIRIELFEWEDYDAAYNGMRKQDEYNERVRASDMFLALFHKKAGKFTIEEFNIARKAFDEQASPKIYTYIKDLEAGESESRKLAEFKRLMLEELGHYWCRYSNFDTMQLHFVLQLQMVEATTPIKVEVKESQVKIGDSTIADLNNVPFTSENATHRELQSRKEQLDREIGNAESSGRRGFFGQRSRTTDEELANLREERESVTEQIERQEKALVDTAMSIARMQGGECSPRMRTAAELFEKGEIDKAEAYCSLGETHCNLEAAEPARECFEKSLKLYREINACPIPLHIDKMAVVLKKLGIVLYVCEEYDTAITLYLEAYELLNAIYRKTGECGEELGSVALCLSETFADTGKARKARKYYDIALKFGAIEEDEEEDYNDDKDEEDEIDEDMEEDDEDGECKESNETDEARTIEDIRIAKKNAHRFKTASDYLEAAKCYTDKGDLQKAKELYIDAIDICEKYLVGGFTEDTYRVKAECCRNFADIIKEEGHLENAMAFYQEALRIYKILKFYSPDYEQALSEVERRIKIFT